MFNSAKQKLRRDINGIYKYTVVGEQVLFILKKKCQQSMNIQRREVMKFVFNEERNRALEQNSKEGR